jgi:hypothetical protein
MHEGAMHVLVLYETRRGFTLTVARRIRDEIRARGHLATASPIRGVDAGTVAAADALIVGSWTRGYILVRVGPAAGAIEGIEALPPLEGRPSAVFCTCDVAPLGTLDELARRLERAGARVLVAHAFRRRRSLAQVPAYVDLCLAEFERALAAGDRPAAAPVEPVLPGR